METRNCYDFVTIGLCIRLLMNVTGTATSGYALRHLAILRKNLETASLEVSLSGLAILDGIEKKLGALDEKAAIGAELSSELSRLFQSIENIVFAESKTKNIFVVPKRRFNAEYLLISPNKFFKVGVFESLSELARMDISSSCRCLAFGEATASAFHLLRATEEVLKNYYYLHKKTNRLERPMWGPMVIELRQKKKNRPPEVILKSLDMVRESYRNPTQHPDAIYDIESAQDLFGVCVDLISKMGAELSLV